MLVPSEDDIDQVVAFTGFTDRTLIRAALQAKNNNLDQVVNEIYDNKTKFISQYGWDDQAFSANRDGTASSQVPSFAIHAPDEGQIIQGHNPDYCRQLGAPSRPPSRANNRSSLSRVVEFTAADSVSGVPVPTSHEQEDAEFKRALAESVAGLPSPHPQPQESGVAEADTSLPYFGPANRADYNQNEWAMITLNRERPEPEPSRRKREPGVPAFLRCRRDDTWDQHRLGALITIFHAIPAARNVLLRSGKPPPQGYGSNPEWWKGKAILRPGVQHLQDAGELTWNNDARAVWTEEVHRLVAFLDSTERSYGTADMLAETRPDESHISADQEKEFFEHIRHVAGNDENIRPLMATAKVVHVLGGEDPGAYFNTWGLLEPPSRKDQLMMATNLYNIWDMIFFMDMALPDDNTAEKRMAIVTDTADIMTIRFGGDDGFPKPIEIPRVFYIDRYLASNREKMSRVQLDMSVLVQAFEKAQRAERALTMAVDKSTGKEVDQIDLNQALIQKSKHSLLRLERLARWRMHENRRSTGIDSHYLGGLEDESEEVRQEVDYTPDEQKIKKHHEAKISFYESQMALLNRKLNRLQAEKDLVVKVFQKLGRLFTEPTDDEEWNPTHSYTLRGVANSVDTFYVCIRAESDLMEIDGPGSASPPTDQWWKLGYVAEDDEPIKAEMTTYETVMEEACGIGSRPLLVYATDKAMEESPDPLSDALQTFVRFDNRLFKQELLQEGPRDRKRGGFTSPSSPSKRLNRSTSLDSMATNQASAGDLDDDMRDAPFENDDPFLVGDERGGPMDVEVVDLVDIRIPDERPDNTRNRSNDDSNRNDSRSELPSPTLGMASVSLSGVAERVGGGGRASEDATNLLSYPPKPPSKVSEDQQQQGRAKSSKTPEMQELGGRTSPFFVQAAVANGKVSGGNRRPMPVMVDMELDDQPPNH